MLKKMMSVTVASVVIKNQITYSSKSQKDYFNNYLCETGISLSNYDETVGF